MQNPQGSAQARQVAQVLFAMLHQPMDRILHSNAHPPEVHFTRGGQILGVIRVVRVRLLIDGEECLAQQELLLPPPLLRPAVRAQGFQQLLPQHLFRGTGFLCLFIHVHLGIHLFHRGAVCLEVGRREHPIGRNGQQLCAARRQLRAQMAPLQHLEALGIALADGVKLLACAHVLGEAGLEGPVEEGLDAVQHGSQVFLLLLIQALEALRDAGFSGILLTGIQAQQGLERCEKPVQEPHVRRAAHEAHFIKGCIHIIEQQLEQLKPTRAQVPSDHSSRARFHCGHLAQQCQAVDL
mmetsp:Transcript_100289/g.239108  ORF Transcript_100289/g.239108 Transcript_100289/m.239108 type:complete len:295 (+) Transcript_100289:2904-3788(+)